ncbi:MAG: class I SAM-dependent methyltransferase [Candidatus Helarchaeota archaeon]
MNNTKLIKLPRDFFDREFRERLIAQFTGLEISQVRERMKTATEQMAREWKYHKGDSNINSFYSHTDGYVFELEDWHIADKMKQAGMITIGSQARGKRFLEYGCGIADTSLIASLAGAEAVDALDLPSITLDYARFRARKFQKKFQLPTPITFIESVDDISKLVLPENHYDIVSAEDVFEHVIDPVAHAKKIYDTLRKGGSMYFSTEFVHSDFHPMHLKSNEKFHGIEWLYELEKIGYEIISPCRAVKND